MKRYIFIGQLVITNLILWVNCGGDGNNLLDSDGKVSLVDTWQLQKYYPRQFFCCQELVAGVPTTLADGITHTLTMSRTFFQGNRWEVTGSWKIVHPQAGVIQDGTPGTFGGTYTVEAAPSDLHDYDWKLITLQDGRESPEEILIKIAGKTLIESESLGLDDWIIWEKQ